MLAVFKNILIMVAAFRNILIMLAIFRNILMMLAVFDGCFVVLCTFGFRYSNFFLNRMAQKRFLWLIFLVFLGCFLIRSCKYLVSGLNLL